MKEKLRWQLPGIGMRNLKTALSATLCAVLYAFVGRNPTFACIGAVFGMGSSLESSYESGGNRFVGTIIGGFLGIGFFYLSSFFEGMPAKIFFLAAGIIALVYLSVILHCAGAIQAGSVVFFIVMLNTPENEYISYGLNRMADTGFGVGMSLLINYLLPRRLCDRIAGRGAVEEEIRQLRQEEEAIRQELCELEQEEAARRL